MPRPIWKGHISFGLVTIPVTLYSAEKRDEMHFKLIDKRNNAGIKYRKVNEVTSEEVTQDNIVRGFEYEPGEYVILGDADFKKAAPEASQSVDIETFVANGAIPPEYFDKPYFLVPSKKGERPYALLREILRKSDCVGVAKVVIRTRQYLAAVIASGDILLLEILRFAHELREAPGEEVPSNDLSELKITDKEMALAEQLVESMKSDWEPETFKDDYRDAITAYVEAKVKSGETTTIAESDEEEEKAPAGQVIDMMTLLKQSMESSKVKRSGEGA